MLDLTSELERLIANLGKLKELFLQLSAELTLSDKLADRNLATQLRNVAPALTKWQSGLQSTAGKPEITDAARYAVQDLTGLTHHIDIDTSGFSSSAAIEQTENEITNSALKLHNLLTRNRTKSSNTVA